VFWDLFGSKSTLQIPPLRFAPVGMTNGECVAFVDCC
jgi:hypothetical protein